MKPRRILLTADTLGGVWQYALELARGLGERGIEVVLATLGGYLDDQRRSEALALPNLSLHESHFRLEWMESPWPDVARAGDWLLDLVDSTAPDLVHLNNYAHGSLDWPVPVLLTAHSCVYSWFDGVYGVPPGPEWRSYWRVVNDGLAGADLVTAPSKAMRMAIETHYRPPRASRVIPNGRRPADFPAGPKQPRILGVGRLWDPAKNLDALARVAPELSWPVRLIGQRHGPDGQVLRLDHVELCQAANSAAIAREYAEAAIYALPARYEPFGLSALEAALAGCALVLGDIPSLREIWGDAALYVPPDDERTLIATLERLSNEPGERQRYAARAERRARRYSAAAMTDIYLATYCSLAACGRRRQGQRMARRCG